MSQMPSAKRQRVDDSSSFAPRAASRERRVARVEELQTKILALPPQLFKHLARVAVAAEPSSTLAQGIDIVYAGLNEHQGANGLAVNFASHARRAYYLFNEKYEHLSGWEQSHAVKDAKVAIEAMLDDIIEKTEDFSVFATKKSAVDTMRLIFEMLVDSRGVIGMGLRRDCESWGRKFLQVISKFDEFDLDDLVFDDNGAWLERFSELVSDAESVEFGEDLQDLVDALQSRHAGDHSDADSDEEDFLNPLEDLEAWLAGDYDEDDEDEVDPLDSVDIFNLRAAGGPDEENEDDEDEEDEDEEDEEDNEDDKDDKDEQGEEHEHEASGQ